MDWQADKRRRKKEKKDCRAKKIREAHAAGNAFDRLHTNSGSAGILPAPTPEPQPKPKWKSRKHKARQQRKKARKAAVRQAEAEKQKAAARTKKAGRVPRRPRRVADYPAYLRSGHWRAKRKEAFAHYGRQCSKCDRTDSLQVHHRHYRTLHHESMEDLQILCGGCHIELHEADPKWVRRQEGRNAQSSEGKQAAES